MGSIFIIDPIYTLPLLAGVAGALYVPQVGIINPSEFSPINSIEIIIWVAVGGRGFLYGAIIGALLVNYGKTFFTGAFPEIWLFMLGALFVITTLFLPKGVVGVVQQWRQKLMERKAFTATGGGDVPPSPPASSDNNAAKPVSVSESVS